MKTSAYTGTATLALLALKRDRVRLTAWILGIALMTGMLIAAFGEMLPAEEDIITMTTVHASNPVMRAFLAPASGISLGGFIMLRMSTVLAIVIAFFGLQTVTRHTRHNEETGCEELIGSTVVGRRAGLLAALLVAAVSTVLLSVLIAVAFMINGQPAAGSFAAGAALGAVCILFAGVGAVTAQLAESTRGANGVAGLAVGASFMLSGVGNMLGEFDAAAMTVSSAWPVWLSPFGWYQQIHAFHQNNWWILILFAAVFALIVKAAFLLNSWRDMGMGMIPAGKGPASAHPGLLTPLGLAWRLQHKLFMVWSVTVLFFGAVFGAMVGEFSEKMSGIRMADQIFGDIFRMNETFVMALVALLGPFIAFYTVQGFLRAVSEEAGGLAEPVLATAVTRPRWFWSHITCFAAGTIVILAALGLGGAVSAFVEPGIRWYKVLEAAMIQAPAILLLAGIFILAFGLLPRWSAAVSWAAVGISFLAGPLLGPALGLPEWVQNISPFTHIPSPTGTITAAPIVIMVLIAVLLTAGGLLSFNRRSLRT